MAIIKCKMCGGDLELLEGATVAECEYCGTTQTVPSADNEKKLTLFSRANRLRAGCEFDKAAGIYESIVADFPQEAEAYWGLILCKYGIEYVDDPATAKKIPTCHRSSFQSILEDSDFELVLENADVLARKVYRDEAKVIEELRKNILSVSSGEKPYDIFICYKETDAWGERTPDSVLAQDIYDALTEKKYRVFFSRITLEDKLGQEYEPYIFAALNSAKIMLAVGTDYEYYNAVWVKNEWSRYLKLMEQDKSRHLIPCYKGIDAYDMPKEFSRLQGQDMNKLGAIQDLLRGIGKLLPKEETVTTKVVVQETVAPGGVSVQNLLKRAQMALEDEKWSAANDFSEQILNVDAENGEAYLYKFMSLANISTQAIIEKNPSLFCEPAEMFSRDIARVRQYAVGALAQWVDKVDDLWQDILDAKKRAEEEARQRAAEAARKKAEEAQRQEQIRKENRKKLDVFRNMQNRLAASNSVWASTLACIKMDGTVLIADKPRKKTFEAEKWKNVVKLDFYSRRAVAVTEENRVESNKKLKDNFGIVDVSVGNIHIAGLKKDGKVCWLDEPYYSEFDIRNWKDIVAISSGSDHIVGLKSNGNVVATGSNKKGQCDTLGWQNIVQIDAGFDHTVGLKADGTVVATGENSGYAKQCDVTNWQNIVQISAGYTHTVGLKTDGTLVRTGGSDKEKNELSHLQNIVAVKAGEDSTIALRADGTVVVVGKHKHGLERVDGVNLFDSLSAEERQKLSAELVYARTNFLKMQ